ncbi:unnamed protein product [Hymenolepis diminuta]|uniref:DUF5727 domain-containing protein n=1 Tax=Hymenolepis diminuta TaxID=6216 RepID=A0A564Y6X5_HYMDI|nr:unnamed protein product [Hymenolepis diminuta]
MIMLHKFLGVIIFVYFANMTWGYKTLPGDTRVIMGAGNTQFSYKTTLPGNYTKLVTGLFTVHFKDGNCSTPFFVCAYVLDDETQMTVQMEGFMSWGLKWINFFGADDLIPITVLFFVDEIWNELAAGSIQPQYSVPLIIGGKDLASVSFSCVIFSTNPKYGLYLDNNKTLYYSNEKTPVTDKTLEFPQILNLETRNIVLHKSTTTTVREKNPIDFYTCNVGNYWLTHTIDWSRLILTNLIFY